MGTHTSIAEMIKVRIDEEEFLASLQIEQEILSYVNSDRSVQLPAHVSHVPAFLAVLLLTISLLY